MGQALCCIQVDHSTVAIIENFGTFGGVLQPGCHYVPWCLGHRVAGHLSLRVQQLDLRCETKTKDNISVTVVASIQYRALKEKPDVAFHELSNIRKQIQKFVFDVISASVRKLNLDDTFEQKNDIAKAVENELKQAILNFGYETVQTLIVDIEPDEHVKSAINKNIAAARLRSSAYEKDEAEKMLLIKLTETERDSKLQAGQGIAKQRDAIVGDYIGNVRAFSNEMPEAKVKDLMDTVLAASILRP